VQGMTKSESDAKTVERGETLGDVTEKNGTGRYSGEIERAYGGRGRGHTQ
jgi:hypothetical protein